ncbi:MAG: hypothetical protein AAF843_05700 [Bacteroidota bacterium]
MIENLPVWIAWLFGITVILTLWLYWLANLKSGKLIFFITIGSMIHSILAFQGFYADFSTMPPRFIFVLLPSTLIIIYGLLPKVRRRVMQGRDLHLSPFVHLVRVPVEMVLVFLFYHDTVPELMTFEGRNFDILAGITAPIAGALYVRGKISNRIMIIWNIVCLALVSFILINGILSAPLPVQQLAFDQPNTGIAYFPFVLLPAVVVPLVIYTHIIDLFILFGKTKDRNHVS